MHKLTNHEGRIQTMKNLKVSDVALMLGKSEQFVRLGLQRNQLPIGTAVKTSTKWSYHISEKLLKEYLGG
jgi:hypothetical protein